MAIAGILLAAGASTRMGRNKLLLELGGEPLVRRAARAALEAALAPVLAVVGHEAEATAAALAGLAVALVRNPDPARGQGSSLAAGAAALPGGVEAAIVLLADMPFAGADALRACVARYAETGAPVVATRYGGVPAPPTLFAHSLFPALAAAAGDGGARGLVRAHADQVAWVERPAGALCDLDDEADYARAREALGEGRHP